MAGWRVWVVVLSVLGKNLAESKSLRSASTVTVLDDSQWKETTSLDSQGLIHRDLQSDSRLWDISTPTISYSGLSLDLDHTVRDLIQTSYVRIDIFQDEQCTVPFQNDDYITVDVINDLTAFGDGSGTRQITVSYIINPTTISNSRIITFTSDYPIVSFCTRFNIIDPDNPDQVANFLDTAVAVRVDITTNFQILALLEDEEDNYVVEVFECDESKNPITQTLKTQGSRVRMCIQPNAYTQSFGVVMKSVNRLKLIRGDVSDEVIVPDGVITDLLQTEYLCTPGDTVCAVETTVANRFFYSRGVVSVEGVAWLQYASSSNNRVRKLIEIPFHHRISENEDLVSNGSLFNRRAVEAGGSITPRNFTMSFEVEPSGSDWKAVAFLCDGRNMPFIGEALARPRNVDDDIRVCFMPSREARERGVYVRAISSFFFQQEKRIQFAIKPTSQQEENAIFICNAGEPLCAVKVELSEDFFNNNLKVDGIGEVLLQYGTEPRVRASSSRYLQTTDDFDPTVDAGFAGRSNVTVNFTTDPTYVPPDELTWQEKAEQWWLQTPLFLRIIYVMAALIALLILLCFLWAICCGNPFAKKKTMPEETKGRKIFIQPIFVRNNREKSEPSDRFQDEEEPEVEATRDIPKKQDETASEHLRLENGPTMEKSNSRRFAKPGDNARHQSFLQIEPDYSKSPKMPSRRASTGEMGTTKSPKTPKSEKRPSSKSPKPRRASCDVESSGASTFLDAPKSPGKAMDGSFSRRSSKSPKPGTKGDTDNSPRRSTRSPKPGGAGDMDNSQRQSKRSSKSPKPGLADMDDSARLSTRSSKSLKSGEAGDSALRSNVASPKPRRSKRAMDSTGSSERSMASNKSPLPKRGSTHNSPRRSTRASLKSPIPDNSPTESKLENSARSTTSRKSKRSSTGERKTIPQAPFVADLD